MKHAWAVFLLALVAGLPLRGDDAARRQSISEKGRALFKNTKNHCHAFRDLVQFAIAQSGEVGVVLEDLKLVLIGETLRTRTTGKYYIGNTQGARGDSGFRAELRDSSPQAEHAFAAIYIGKNFPPGSAEAIALATEVMGPLTEGQKLNAADALLYSLGADLGQRMSKKELGKVPSVIDKTMCE
jgi:hypothetical protein